MSFSKAKLKRFNDVDVVCGSPAPIKHEHAAASCTGTGTPTSATTNASSLSSSSSTSVSASSTSGGTAHTERKEQIEKFFKDAVRFASSSKEAKEFAIPKEGGLKEDKKSKGLRLFRTPSLPQRLRFRQHSDVTTAAATAATSTASSTPLNSAATTPLKELAKSGSRLKGKEALQHEIRQKNELIGSYLSQIDVLKRHVEKLKEAEQKLREEQACAAQRTDSLIEELTNENRSHKELNERLSDDNAKLLAHCAQLEAELKAMQEQHAMEVAALQVVSDELKSNNAKLETDVQEQLKSHEQLIVRITNLEQTLTEAREKLVADEAQAAQNFKLIENLKQTNDGLFEDVSQLKQHIEQDAAEYAHEAKTTQNELECLKNERNTLKNDLANKCTLIRSLQDELLDKTCEIDAHCDTIRQLCREKAKYAEKERQLETAEQQVRMAEVQAEQKVQKLESDLENAVEREKAYWRGELDKRQKLAENELIKIELEKQDVMVLLETTNDMLRERDDKLQKYEDQLRNGIDYYVQLTDTLQKQVVDLKQDMAKTITEKYNYQLTLNNTRATVNILMERLKKSDADVEQFKAELESVHLAKGALEQSYLTLQAELETLRKRLVESEAALTALHATSETLQHEVSVKETMFNEILTSEEETLAKFNKIATSFQARIDSEAARYLEMYNELKTKDDQREIYMQDMKKALDEFATVLQIAQYELDHKEQSLGKVREECEQLKLENITLKSKVDTTPNKNKPNTTDLEKIEDLLIDSELRAECDKITTWLLSSAEKCVRNDNTNELSELLKPTTPKSRPAQVTTPVRNSSACKLSNLNSTGNATVSSTTPHTPRTPRTPRTPKNVTGTPRKTTTPKKTVLFATGKENMPSPQKQVLKTRNM